MSNKRKQFVQRTVGTFSLKNRGQLNQFNKILRKDGKKPLTYSEYSKLHKLFDKVVRETTLNTQGGLYLNRIGYFCNMIIPYKYRDNKHGSMNMHNPYIHLPTFFPEKNSPFKTFYLDRSTNKPYRQLLTTNLKNGMKYKVFLKQINDLKNIEIRK